MTKLIIALLAGGIIAFPHPEGYYKHLVMDAGKELTQRDSFPAGNGLARELGFEWERVRTTSQTVMRRYLAGNRNPAWPLDSNGLLVYPDGAPRYRMIYVNGGQSGNHGNAVGDTGRQRFRDFFYNGGSYVGTCAGAFFASQRATHDLTTEGKYLHLWPGQMSYAGFPGRSYPALDFVDVDSMLSGVQNPLLQFHTFGGDARVDGVYFNGGPFMVEADIIRNAGTEILARYYMAGKTNSGKPGLIAYKPDDYHGRCIMNGTHPEIDSSSAVVGVGHPATYNSTGERYELFSAKIQYAIAGQGKPRIKAELFNRSARVMDDNNRPGFEKLGDYQYHHYKITVPSGKPFLRVRVTGRSGYPFNLHVRKDSPAFRSVTPANQADTSAGHDKTVTLAGPAAGDYYIGVELDTTVHCVQDSVPFYSGALDVLDGIPYTIRADFDDEGMARFHLTTAASHGRIALSPAGGAYDSGAVVTAEARPDPGYRFSGWSYDLSGSVSPSSLVMAGNRHLAARFVMECPGHVPMVPGIVLADSFGNNVLGVEAGPNDVNCTLKVAFERPAEARDLRFLFRAFDVDSAHEIKVVLNGRIMLGNAKRGRNNNWSLVNDSFTVPYAELDSGCNLLRVIDTALTSQVWAVKNLLLEPASGLTAAAAVSPRAFAMAAGPNPFNPALRLAFDLPHACDVRLAVYAINGALVADLLNGRLNTGRHSVVWNPGARSGIGSGIYYAVFRAGEYRKTLPVTFAK